MYTKKTRDFLSVAIAAITALLLIYTVFSTILTHTSIYNLFSARTILMFCFLFIAFTAVRATKELTHFDVPALVCAFVLSALIVINAPFNYLETIGERFYRPALNMLLQRSAYYIAVFGFYLVFLYFLFSAVRTLFLSKAPIKQASGSCDVIYGNTYIRLTLMAAAYVCIFALLYQPYFPHGTTPDTQNQWDQIHGTLAYNRIHSIGHTVLLRALLSLWDDYTIVILFHITAVAFIYILFSQYFCKQKLRPVLIAAVFCLGLFFTCKFSAAYFYSWKDTPAAVCLAVVCFFLIRYRQAERIGSLGAFFLGLALAGCFLFRLNGIIALIVCGSFFLVVFLKKRHYRQLLTMLVSIALTISFINIYSDRVLKPADYKNGFSIQVFASGLAAMVDSGELSEEELAEIDEIVSVKWMRDVYGHNIHKYALIWGTDNSPEIQADKNLEIFNNQFVLDLGEHKAEVIKLYLKLMPKHLGVCIQDIIGSLYLMWSVPDVFLYSYPFVLLLLVYLVIKARLSLADCVVFLPSLCNTFSIMISTITNEKRYLLPMFMLAPVYFLYILMKSQQSKAAGDGAVNISN